MLAPEPKSAQIGFLAGLVGKRLESDGGSRSGESLVNSSWVKARANA